MGLSSLAVHLFFLHSFNIIAGPGCKQTARQLAVGSPVYSMFSLKLYVHCGLTESVLGSQGNESICLLINLP